MFKIAEQAFGRAYVEKIIKGVTPNLRDYNDDQDSLTRARILLGNRLSKHFKNQ